MFRADFGMVNSGSNAPEKQQSHWFPSKGQFRRRGNAYFVLYGKYKLNLYFLCGALSGYV